jgi:hypothetical protein
MTVEQKRYFRSVHKKTVKRVFDRGDVNLVNHGLAAGWTIERVVGKINAGHGERWV